VLELGQFTMDSIENLGVGTCLTPFLFATSVFMNICLGIRCTHQRCFPESTVLPDLLIPVRPRSIEVAVERLESLWIEEVGVWLTADFDLSALILEIIHERIEYLLELLSRYFQIGADPDFQFEAISVLHVGDVGERQDLLLKVAFCGLLF
jgi:hypothetical protein